MSQPAIRPDESTADATPVYAARFGKIAERDDRWPVHEQIQRLRRNAPGWIGSFIVHAALVALFLLLTKHQQPIGQNGVRLVPVTIVPFSGSFSTPRAGENAAPIKSAKPALVRHHSAARRPSRVGLAPRVPPKDELDAKLESLSKLVQSQPGSLPQAQNFAATEPGENGEGEGTGGSYGVRDLVRQQVLRRWSLDLEMLGARNYIIAIHVELKRNGTVLKAEIVDQKRFRTDKIFHEVALSARNAVLLSSPLVLPTGRYEKVFDMIVLFNPRDTQR